MKTVFIVPTGIGCTIGGHAGDATPSLRLIASVSDIAITHPNVVNASDINEMPDNTWYVEGSILDRFLRGEILLEKPLNNRILLVTNGPIEPTTVNAVNAARNTIGCEIAIVELRVPLEMIATMDEAGAGGIVNGWEQLVEQIAPYKFDALAIASRITVSTEANLHYLKHGGINPYGGVEAVASKLIANAIDKPVAHAPVETQDAEVLKFKEVVDPRMAAELVSMAYIHCVFKGLHKAPRPSDRGLSVRDVDCLVTPLNCFGPPHKACLNAGIPIIAVAENTTCLDIRPPNYILAYNYLEAAAIIQLIREGMSVESVRRFKGVATEVPIDQVVLLQVGEPAGPSLASEWTKGGDYEADGTCDYSSATG